MPDKAITVDEILTSAHHYDHKAHMALRRSLSVALGAHAEVCFESRATALGFLQSLISLEGLSCPVSLEAECDEAACLWQLPRGALCVTLTLLPKASMTSAQLCEALAAPVASLCLDVDGQMCPVRLEGRLTPRSQGHVQLPEAAQKAILRGDADVALVWTGLSPMRVPVSPDVSKLWTRAWHAAP